MTGEEGRYQVETYMSGVPYKIARFDSALDAQAYQRELHAQGHYYVMIIDRDTADRTQWGTRLDMSVTDCGRVPYAR